MHVLSRECRALMALRASRSGAVLRAFRRYKHIRSEDYGAPVPTGNLRCPPIQEIATVAEPYYNIDIQKFRDMAFTPEKPLLMRGGLDMKPRPFKGTPAETLPATTKWFQYHVAPRMDPKIMTFTDHVRNFALAMLPYELTYATRAKAQLDSLNSFIEALQERDDLAPSALSKALASHLQEQIPPLHSWASETGPQRRLIRFDAPLALLDTAAKYNMIKTPMFNGPIQVAKRRDPVRYLYIAQAPVNYLPEDLQKDLPTPRIVERAGKGDVYDSSVWLGVEPTYTTLHRDPNPNLFIQLCSSKLVRLIPPANGEVVYREALFKLGLSNSHLNMRSVESMEGLERSILNDITWKDNWVSTKPLTQEAVLYPGDALFIPKGWWHSIKSTRPDGRLNGSVNWWFR